MRQTQSSVNLNPRLLCPEQAIRYLQYLLSCNNRTQTKDLPVAECHVPQVVTGEGGMALPGDGPHYLFH